MRRRSSSGDGPEANGVSGRDWLLVKGLATFFWQGGPYLFPPRARFFSLGFTFCEMEQDTRLPQREGF
jgi:hypothetical protein